MIALALAAASLIDLLRADLVRSGIPVAVLTCEYDPRHKPAESRTVPKPMGIGTMERDYYPITFRWKFEDGRRFGMVLNPIVKGEYLHPVEDWRAEMDALVAAIRESKQ